MSSDMRSTQEQLLHAIMEHYPLSIMEIDLTGQIVAVNRYTCDITGFDEQELVNKHYRYFLNDQMILESSNIFDLLMRGRFVHLEMEFIHKLGAPVYLQMMIFPIYGNGQIKRVMLISHDITDRRRVNDKIRYMSFYDDVTGLPNRKMFTERLTELLATSRRTGTGVAVASLDLDRFKLVNDTLGQEFGDMLLLQVAERLTRIMSDEDMVARKDGDEFIIYFKNVTTAAEAMLKGQLIVEALEEPFLLIEQAVTISASVGLSRYEHGEQDVKSLINQADIALSMVKSKGSNHCLLYSHDMSPNALEHLTMQHDLRQALIQGQFVLYYQPQYHIGSGKMVGVEALVRWHHPERGLLLPDLFIPLAEESGLIVPLGDWVLEEACRQNKRWQDEGLSRIPVSVNLSMRQFAQQNLYETVERILAKTGLLPRYLDLEITESMAMDVQYTTQCLMKLRNLGIAISIDDFGTGYSSFSYLKECAINRLKIDRSFVNGVHEDASAQAIVASIISMAHHLNMQVIAEGVELEDQVSFLREHQCDEIQGYFYSPPVSADQVKQMFVC